MSIEINHMIVPATDKVTSARFLGGILGLEVGKPVSHFQPLQVGSVTLDFDNATNIRPLHIAFQVDEETFEAAHRRLVDAEVATYADPGRRQPGEIYHRPDGGRGVYFDDPDRHLFELLTAPDNPIRGGDGGRA